MGEFKLKNIKEELDALDAEMTQTQVDLRRYQEVEKTLGPISKENELMRKSLEGLKKMVLQMVYLEKEKVEKSNIPLKNEILDREFNLAGVTTEIAPPK